MLNLVFGVPAEVSEHLLAKDAVRKISFTGSIPVGKHLAALAAKGMKRTTMELGGHSPVVVFADADPEKAADTIAAFKYRNAGQVCISPTRFYVQEDVYKSFLARFTEYAKGIKLGDGLEKGITMGPMANARRIEAMESFVADAKQRGGKIVTGGKRHGNQGYFYEPTVITDVPDDSKIMTQEPFGPIAPIVTFKTFDEVVERANSLEFGLAAYAFTTLERDRGRDRRRAAVRHGRRQLDRDLDAGDAVRRRQGIRPRQRGRHRGARAPISSPSSSRRADPVPTATMRGLDPRIHPLTETMGCRVKPGDDDVTPAPPSGTPARAFPASPACRDARRRRRESHRRWRS